MIAIVVPGVAVVGQGSCHRRSWWWCRRAATLCGLATVGLLSGRPSSLPIRVTGVAVIGATTGGGGGLTITGGGGGLTITGGGGGGAGVV